MLTSLKQLHRHLAIAFLLVLGSVGLWAHITASDTLANTENYCSADILLTQPLPGSTISGVYPLQVNVPSTAPIESVTFYVDNILAGSGTKTSTTAWNFGLNTLTYPNGKHFFYAVVTQSSTADGSYSYACRTNTVDAHIFNTLTTSSSSLEIATNVPSWSGPTNYPLDIGITATLVSDGKKEDVTSQASYEWKTSLGRIDAFKNVARFNSGPNPGEGTIAVRVVYSNHVKELFIPVKVSSATTATTFPSSSTTSTTSTSTITPPNTTPVTTATQQNNQGDPALEDCLVKLLGAVTYQNITEKDMRLSFEDYTKSQSCFARRKFVIPARLAPVAPGKVKNLPLNTDLAVKKLETVSGNGKEAIQLTGIAAPNKTIFIYIFSEPLVLSTKAGSDGRWSYTLEDPLAPGKHEAYVTVEGEPAQPSRSNVFNFAVATAPPTAENPLGLSFTIENTSKPVLFRNIYLIGSLLLVGLAIGTAVFFVRKYKHTGSSSDTTTPTINQDPPVSSNVQG